MTTYTVTTSNWNDPSFWSGINESGPGHALDLSALPSTYTTVFDDNDGTLTISDGTTSYVIGETSNGNIYEDVELGGSTSWDFFTTFTGGQGADYLEGSNDAETFFLGDGDDTLVDSGGNTSVDGGGGSDSITTSSGDDTIEGGSGNDTIVAGTGADSIDGGEGSDWIDAGGGDDTVYGGTGDDSILGDGGLDTLYGEEGNDTIDGGDAADLVDGGDGDDLLLGGAGDDTLIGGAGLDTLTGGAGFNTFFFGRTDGSDTITDFTVNKDTVHLSFFEVNDFADVTPLMSQDGLDTVLTFGDGSILRLQNVNSGDLGASNFTYDPAMVCYAPGTMIDTPEGPQAVETLQPGDLVLTLDHGPQAIRWIRSGDHPLEQADVDAKPVQIKAGALGRNLPAQDLIVSPQHRILVGGAGQLQQVFAAEAFAPAKSLTSVPGIRHMKGKTKITWIHFACDRHEVVIANGCLSEALLLGPMVVNGLTATERQAVTDIFGPAPTHDAALNGPPARECLKVGAVRRQIAKHLKEKGQLLAKEIKKWDVDAAMERFEAERLREANPRSQVNMKHVA